MDGRRQGLSRRGFIGSALATGVACAFGETDGAASVPAGARTYSVPLLGDTHFDAAPAETYHAAFIRRYAAAGLQPNKSREHIRNGKMWAGPMRDIIRASAQTVRDDAAFVLHLGDLVQGDCCDGTVHRRMLEDAWRYFKGEYDAALPFVTVCGNHDVRDPDGHEAERVYADFMPPRMAAELGGRAVRPITSTDFVFRQGPDLFFVFDFNDNKEVKVREPTVSHARFLRQRQLLLENRAARHTFVVVHGGVFPLDKASDFRWFWLGDPRQADERREMMRLLAERNAIVLCGHQHVLSLKDAAFPQGRITEFTMNTVFYGHGMKENPAVPEVVYDDPAKFGSLSGENEWWKGADARIHDEYRPHLRRCYHAKGAGHAVLRVSDAGVAVDYCGHAARTPTAVFTLRETGSREV